MRTLSEKQRKISYCLKILVALSAVAGTALSAYAGRGSFMGGSRVFMYFTIQSNLLMAVISLVGLCLLMRKKTVSSKWYLVKFIGTVSITLTGIVFAFVLAPTLGAQAWNFQNTLTHVVVPLGSVIDFFVVGSNIRLPKKSALLVIIPPLLYACYAGIGYVLGWEFAEGIRYPYFFLNWGSPAGAFGFTNGLPFIGTAWWILILFLFVICVGWCYLTLIDVIYKKSKGGKR